MKIAFHSYFCTAGGILLFRYIEKYFYKQRASSPVSKIVSKSTPNLYSIISGIFLCRQILKQKDDVAISKLVNQ